MDAADPCDQARERFPSLLERTLAEILALEAEKVEGDQGGAPAACLGAQGAEIGMASREERDRLAVD
jgi:hypothetical protein